MLKVFPEREGREFFVDNAARFYRLALPEG